ncbi:hypothetical protein OM076_01070 [Solirubrobacter ginsenosidimutans]|uniref:Secreted protein n=1 Tax=Solirubrobacter ginsenosidimutans TaxID=490573 RepID=A0A9X3MLY5_9ACTN|nr:hypothetical protein [Solirubrobacter ginsenosidimutans]MDA0158839.1 hypothetical protein [Solirubrobacter ginsenosidimutans]
MRPTRTITVPLAAVLAAAALASPATAQPIDFAVHLSDPATRTSANLSSADPQHAPCTSGLAETTSRPRQNPRSMLESVTPRAQGDRVMRELRETTVAP